MSTNYDNPNHWEQRPSPGSENFKGPTHLADGHMRAFAAVGQPCQRCKLTSRLAYHVCAVDGEQRAICDDCHDEIRFDRIHERHCT